MAIDYSALSKELGDETQDPILGQDEIDPQTGLTLSTKDIERMRF